MIRERRLAKISFDRSWAFPWHRGAGLLLAALLWSQSGPAVSAGCCKLFLTSFGSVEVPSRDKAKAIHLGEHVNDVARRLFDLSNIRFGIADATHTKARWGHSAANGSPVYPWRFSNGTRSISQPADGVLPHEIGHDLFRRYLYPSSRSHQYGTDAPDWLDEAVAIAFELPDDKAQRRCELTPLLKSGDVPSLSRFLAMPHPSLADIPAAQAAGQITQTSVIPPDTPGFYGLALAFPEYLAERLGSERILLEVTLALRNGRSFEHWLAEHIDLKGRSFSLLHFDAAFREWLKTAKAYQC